LKYLVTTAGLGIDSGKVKEIATRFLEQHCSVLEIKQTVLQDDIWLVTVLLSSSNDQIRKVRIDAKTGRIIDWSR
jgi:uncharacterized membrane protein YkoI